MSSWKVRLLMVLTMVAMLVAVSIAPVFAQDFEDFVIEGDDDETTEIEPAGACFAVFEVEEDDEDDGIISDEDGGFTIFGEGDEDDGIISDEDGGFTIFGEGDDDDDDDGDAELEGFLCPDPGPTGVDWEFIRVL